MNIDIDYLRTPNASRCFNLQDVLTFKAAPDATTLSTWCLISKEFSRLLYLIPRPSPSVLSEHERESCRFSSQDNCLIRQALSALVLVFRSMHLGFSNLKLKTLEWKD